MKLAFIRAGLWFFATVITALVLADFDAGAVLSALGIGALFAGLIFFITWYNIAKEDRRREEHEQRYRETFGVTAKDVS